MTCDNKYIIQACFCYISLRWVLSITVIDISHEMFSKLHLYIRSKARYQTRTYVYKRKIVMPLPRLYTLLLPLSYQYIVHSSSATILSIYCTLFFCHYPINILYTLLLPLSYQYIVHSSSATILSIDRTLLQYFLPHTTSVPNANKNENTNNDLLALIW